MLERDSGPRLEARKEERQEIETEEGESAHEPLLSVENNSCASPRKIKEVKDNCVNIRATVDTGAAGHVMQARKNRRLG